MACGGMETARGWSWGDHSDQAALASSPQAVAPEDPMSHSARWPHVAQTWPVNW